MYTNILTFTTLISLTSALPSGLRRTEPSPPADISECWKTDPGSVFYNCKGYIGCFHTSPCEGAPAPTPVPAPPAPTTPKVYTITKPRSYNIYVRSEAQHNIEDRVYHVDLHKPADSTITTTNAMVFDNVPAGAKNCRLRWRTSEPDSDNVFTVAGDGNVWTRQLTGFPVQGVETVSYDGLKKYQDPAAEWSPSLSFADWIGTVDDHTGPSMECGSQVAVELMGAAEPFEQENRVFLTLTETNGFYLSYEL